MRRTLLLLSILTLIPWIAAAAPPRVQFGIQSGQEGVTWSDVLSAWKEAETLGFDSAWNFDHLMPIVGDKDGPCLESWTMLGALAA